jgi:hypothetical protein
VATDRTVNFVPLLRAWRCSGSAPTNPIKEIEFKLGHENVSFFCPIFLDPQKREAAAPKASGVLYGRDLWCLGGTEKAETAKLPGAGIWPEAVPGKCAAEKGTYRNQ